MVDDRLSDGVRIAQLLASEITGNRGRLRDLTVTDADPDVVPTIDGALAYRVVLEEEVEDDPANPDDAATDLDDADDAATDLDDADDDADADPDDVPGSTGDLVAEAYVQPDRVRLEFPVAPDVAAAAGRDSGLRVRPKAVRPPRTLVFVEDGAAVKRVLAVFEAVLKDEREG